MSVLKEKVKKKQLYSIVYSSIEGGLLEEKYNADGILFEERFHPALEQ